MREPQFHASHFIYLCHDAQTGCQISSQDKRCNPAAC